MATWVDYFVTICISGIPFSFLTSTRPFYKKSMLEKITEIYNWNYINIMIKECIRCSMSHFLACVAIFCLLYVVILYCYLHLCQNVEMWVSAMSWKRCIINTKLSRECEWNKDLSVVVTRLDKIDKVQIQIHKDLLVCYTLCQKKNKISLLY
jgi:hypothetical protein